MIELLILGSIWNARRELDEKNPDGRIEAFLWTLGFVGTIFLWPISAAWLFYAMRIPAWLSVILGIGVCFLLFLLLGGWYFGIGFILGLMALVAAVVAHLVITEGGAA